MVQQSENWRRRKIKADRDQYIIAEVNKKEKNQTERNRYSLRSEIKNNSLVRKAFLKLCSESNRRSNNTEGFRKTIHILNHCNSTFSNHLNRLTNAKELGAVRKMTKKEKRHERERAKVKNERERQ
jgi:hypothetical protein